MALVSRGECSGVWLSDFNYLCLAGAESCVGLCVYLGGGFRSTSVGGLVVVEGTGDRDTARGVSSDGGGIGVVAGGPSLAWEIFWIDGLEGADGEGDGGKKKGGSCEADGEQALVVIGGATSCGSLE